MRKDAVEHSADARFLRLPLRRRSQPAPGTRRFVYVGFESVSPTDTGFINGGFADDVWVVYAGGAFHPHIENLSIEQVASANPGQSAARDPVVLRLAHSIRIHDADIWSLAAEQDDDWKNAPRRDTAFSKANWDSARIKA